jgi:hypothetical protein
MEAEKRFRPVVDQRMPLRAEPTQVNHNTLHGLPTYTVFRARFTQENAPASMGAGGLR